METQLKFCPQCHSWLGIGCFHKNKSMKDGLQTYCKECNKSIRSAHPEYAKISQERRYSKNREKEIQRSQDYYDLHQEERRKYGREYYQKYRQTEEGKIASNNHWHRRRLAISNTPPEISITNQELLQLKKSFTHCPYCGCEMTEEWNSKYVANYKTIEHVVPITEKCGGLHTKDNIVYCCYSCNSSKKDNNVETWLNKKLGDNYAS